MDIVKRARRYLAQLPRAQSGSGGHNATFRAACVLIHGFDLAEGDALALLAEWNVTHCEPQWSHQELEHKVRTAATAASDKPRGYLLKGTEREAEAAGGGGRRVAPPPREPEPGIPEFDLEKLRAQVAGMPEVTPEMLIERSPIDPRQVGPGEFLEHVFRPGERVLVFTNFRSQGDFLWEVGKGGFRLADRRGVQAVASELPAGGPEGVWFLNQPIDGGWHGNPRQGGRFSRRSEEAVTSWRHVVFESDCAPEGMWLQWLARLGKGIKAIYSSGGKSWHALIEEERGSSAEFGTVLRAVKKIAPIFGADGRALTPVRLTRLPGCMRGKRLQRLIYLDPRPPQEVLAIIDRPARRVLG